MKERIAERIMLLREEIKKRGFACCLIPSADYHQSEYVSDYFRVREYYSGFTGSNGTLVIGLEEAGLWTDGRYYIQAEKELEGTGIRLFAMGQEGVPTVPEYLVSMLGTGDCVVCDGRAISAAYGRQLEKLLEEKGILFTGEEDPAGSLWKDRPAFPQGEIRILPEELCGESTAGKQSRLRGEMAEKQVDMIIFSRLDDIMWLFNIRGNDVPFNPVALSHAIITEKETYLFVSPSSVTAKLQTYCERNQIILKDYFAVEDFLQEIPESVRVMADPAAISFTFYKSLLQTREPLWKKSSVELWKAVKNETEKEHIKRIYKKDSAILTTFLYWLKREAGKQPITESSAAAQLDAMRLSDPECTDLSFPTICAYRENAAMMHYQAEEGVDLSLEESGMLLIDSGGQYLGGTTDVTRTVALGRLTHEIKKYYTAAVSGMLQLQSAVFLKGCTGRNLDILARQPLWDLHTDYKCGTGHGIGYMLNVHEGPQNIRFAVQKQTEEVPFEPGMITSNEPGVYRKGAFGIRIENIMLCTKKAENEDGCFLGFEPLTYVPIDRDAIEPELLSPDNRERLNAYHAKVYEMIAPMLGEEEQKWLREATASI